MWMRRHPGALTAADRRRRAPISNTGGTTTGGTTTGGGTTGGGTTGGHVKGSTTGGDPSAGAGGTLPFTGLPVWMPILLAFALLASGGFLLRRKRDEVA
jgi:LPXTG-motif cell wall-anchored protein